MCLDTVEGASSSSSTIWQTHSSPPVSDRRIRNRLPSASALLMSRTVFISNHHISPYVEMYSAPSYVSSGKRVQIVMGCGRKAVADSETSAPFLIASQSRRGNPLWLPIRDREVPSFSNHPGRHPGAPGPLQISRRRSRRRARCDVTRTLQVPFRPDEPCHRIPAAPAQWMPEGTLVEQAGDEQAGGEGD